jgi:hypothetical protein
MPSALDRHATGTKEHPLVNRYLRFELYTALAAFILALVAGLYLAISTFAQHEACYGMVAGKLTCQQLVPGTVAYAQAAGRAALVLTTVLALYGIGALGAWWQSRTKENGARTTAYMLVVCCGLTDIAITLPAIGGVGFYLVPSAVLVTACAILGLIALLQAGRAPTVSSAPDPSSAAPAAPATPVPPQASASRSE